MILRSFGQLLLAVVGTSLAVAPFVAEAAFHRLKVREIYAGSAAHPDAQYVVLQMAGSGQNRVTGHGIQVYDSAGVKISDFKFPADLPVGTNQAYVLIATAGAETYFGVQADLEVPLQLPRAGGMLCFDNIDCVSWGNYSGSNTTPSPSGAPFNALEGLVLGQPVVRNILGSTLPAGLELTDDTDSSVADLFFGAAPLPTNNASHTGSLPHLVSLTTSANAGGVPDKAVIALNPLTNETTLQVRDGIGGELITSASLGSSLRPLYVARVPDLNANGSDEVVCLGINRSTGALLADVRDSGTGAQLSLASFSTDRLPHGFVVTPDLNASGTSELALLGLRPSDASLQAEIIDGGTAAPVKLVSFDASTFKPRLFSSVSDVNGNGAPELIVTGVRPSDGVVRAEFRDTTTGNRFATPFLGASSPLAVSEIPDLTADGVPEIAFLLRRLSDQVISADIRNGATRSKVRSVFFAKTYAPIGFGSIADVNGNSAPDLVVLGFDAAVNTLRGEIRDGSTGTRIRQFTKFVAGYRTVDSDLSVDLNGNGSNELDVLGRKESDGSIHVEARDTATGARINIIEFN